MKILDHISASLETIFWVKILQFVDADSDPDPGSGNLFDPISGMEKFGSGNQNKHPGSATLPYYLYNSKAFPLALKSTFFSVLS
jgi:hypothetical protein